MKKTLTFLLVGLLALVMALPVYANRNRPQSDPATAQIEADIGADGAQRAALQDAGLLPGDGAFLCTRRGRTADGWVYRVIFLTSDTTHVYEIDAQTGGVVSHYASAVYHQGAAGSVQLTAR